MRPEQFQREKDYGAGVAIAGGLLKRGYITPGEYRRAKAALLAEYRPVIGLLDVGASGISPKTGDSPH